MIYNVTLNYLLLQYLQKKKKNPRKYDKHPINKNYRQKFGFENIIKVYSFFPSKFFDLFRMTTEQYQIILDSIFFDVLKMSRNAFPPDLRLNITLRYACSGLPVSEIAHEFLIGENTASGIIMETCLAIAENLKHFIKFPAKKSDWYQIANGFFKKNRVPNAIGAIDGKHIFIRKPDNSGSAYKNYKHGFSLSLLAICDSNYKFLYYDIGAYGSESDSGIYKDSPLFQRMMKKELEIPNPEYSNVVNNFFPFCFYGDAAFGLHQHMMRPYEGKLLAEIESYFNYRHSSMRIAIEQAFGILVSRFRVFSSAMGIDVEKVEAVVSACVTLHNFLITTNKEEDEEPVMIDNDYSNDMTDEEQPQLDPKVTRNNLAKYFFLQRQHQNF